VVYALTHCESFYNKREIFTGWVDSKLTPEGHRQAKKLARELKHEQIATVYVSPLTRTKETARYFLADHPEAKVVVDRRIIERDYGQLVRKSKRKFAKEHPDLYPIYHRAYDVPPPGGESMKTVEKRVLSFLEELIKKLKKERQNVLIVCHGNSMRPMRRYFEGLTTGEMMKLEDMRNRIFKYQVK